MSSSFTVVQFSALTLAGLVWAMPAQAQSGHANEIRSGIEYEDVTVLEEDDFSDLSIEATLAKPNHTLLQVRGSSHFNPLIQLRRSFTEEISSSVDEVR